MPNVKQIQDGDQIYTFKDTAANATIANTVNLNTQATTLLDTTFTQLETDIAQLETRAVDIDRRITQLENR